MPENLFEFTQEEQAAFDAMSKELDRLAKEPIEWPAPPWATKRSTITKSAIVSAALGRLAGALESGSAAAIAADIERAAK